MSHNELPPQEELHDILQNIRERVADIRDLQSELNEFSRVARSLRIRGKLSRQEYASYMKRRDEHQAYIHDRLKNLQSARSKALYWLHLHG